MNTKVKICGLKALKDIRIINKYNVDYIGFVFAESSRRVNIESAKKMRQLLKDNVKAVGVFVDTPSYEINDIVSYCKLDIVQMHGVESPEECEKIIVPVWKAISMRDDESLNKVKDYKTVCGFLLDGVKAGSGECFKWKWAEDFSKRYFSILAGGLNEHNVLQAIKLVRPQVVDVSSGVESNGYKDEEKIANFIRKVKENE